MTRRVVISGMATINAVGHQVDETWQAICAGQSGVRPISAWPTEGWTHTMGAAVQNFDVKRALPDRKLLKLISPFDVFGLYVVPQALAHSGWLTHRETLPNPAQFNDKTGIYVGSPGNKFYQQYEFMPLLAEAQGDLHYFADHLMEMVQPMWLLQILPNNVLAYAGIQHGFKGANQNIVNHGVSGLQAIIEATAAIRQGQIDRALVVSYESLFDPQGLMYYVSLNTASPTGARPFDKSRDGMVIGEGAGALTLETYEEAVSRGATIYAEILAGKTVSEHAGVYAISENGEGISNVLAQTLEAASIKPAELGAICAHGNGTVLSDQSEAVGIARVMGRHRVPVTGYKWALGHTLASSGVIDTLLTVKALESKQLPGIATLQHVAPECAGIAVSATVQDIQSPIAAILARGFGSLNACVLIKKVS